MNKTNKDLEAVWTQIQLDPNPFTPRTGTAYCQINNKVYLHGGQNFMTNSHFDDFFELNLGINIKNYN